VSEARTIIAFDEGQVGPSGRYCFRLELKGRTGCDIIEQMAWLVDSLQSPYELRINDEAVEAGALGLHHSTLTVWTNDRDNPDFLMLMHELGVEVVRAVPDADDG